MPAIHSLSFGVCSSYLGKHSLTLPFTSLPLFSLWNRNGLLGSFPQSSSLAQPPQASPCRDARPCPAPSRLWDHPTHSLSLPVASPCLPAALPEASAHKAAWGDGGVAGQEPGTATASSFPSTSQLLGPFIVSLWTLPRHCFRRPPTSEWRFWTSCSSWLIQAFCCVFQLDPYSAPIVSESEVRAPLACPFNCWKQAFPGPLQLTLEKAVD